MNNSSLTGVAFGPLGKFIKLEQKSNIDCLSFSVGISKEIPDRQNGGTRTKTTWVQCSVWGNKAKEYKPQLREGVMVQAVGDMELYNYFDQQAQEQVCKLQLKVNQLVVVGAAQPAQQQAQQHNGTDDSGYQGGDFDAGDLGPPLDEDSNPLGGGN